jgi:hypothetical protein
VTARCPLTDLLVDQCACPQHRGEPASAPGDDEELGPVFTAQYLGRCVRCDGQIVPGDRITRAIDGGYAHANSGRCR